MITWLLPAALLLAVVAVVAIGRAPRTDGRRAALILWTGWTVVTGLTFSLMEGTYHDYYVVALAPAIAAGVAVGGTVPVEPQAHLARPGRARPGRRGQRGRGRSSCSVGRPGSTRRCAGRCSSSACSPRSRCWSRTGSRASPRTSCWPSPWPVRLTGPAAYTLNTVATPHTGSIVTAGPVRSEGGFRRADPRRVRTADRTATADPAADVPGGGTPPQGQAGGTQAGRDPGGGFGGVGGTGTASAELVQLLQADAGSLPLGRGDDRLAERRDLPARQRAAGDGDRRLHRRATRARRSRSSRPTSRPATSTTSSPAAAWAAAAAAGTSSEIATWVDAALHRHARSAASPSTTSRARPPDAAHPPVPPALTCPGSDSHDRPAPRPPPRPERGPTSGDPT